VADKQQTAVGWQAGKLGKCLARVKTVGERRVCRQQLTLLTAPMLSGQLGRLQSSYLGAVQNRVEAGLEPRQRDPGRMCLAFAALGQTAFSVLARTMGFGIPVT
jgi:hypothetical protein